MVTGRFGCAMLGKREGKQAGKNALSNSLENRKLLLHLIFEGKEVSRKELAEVSGLKAATVTILINQFMEEGLVEECGLGDIGGQRKVRMLRMKNIYCVISVRLHRTYFSVVSFDLKRNELYRNRIYHSIIDAPEIACGLLKEEITRMKEIAEEKNLKVLGIALGANDSFHINNGSYQYLSSVNREYYDFAGILERDTGIPVEINRNCNLCSYQLWKTVWKQQTGIIAAMLVSYSIECGIVIDGNLLDGYQGRSGKIGEMKCERKENGDWCTFNEAASTTQLLSRASQLREQYPESVLSAKESFSVHDLLDAYEADDSLGRQVYDEMTDYYAEALARIANVLNPDLFFIGGSIPLTREYQIRIFEKTMRIIFGDAQEILVEDDTETGIITLHSADNTMSLKFVSPEIAGTAKDPIYGGVAYIVDDSIENENYFIIHKEDV